MPRARPEGVPPAGSTTRATVAVVGIALLLGITVVAGALVGATALSVTPEAPAERVALTLAADADANRLTLGHGGGDTLDVRDLSLSIRVDGEDLAHQPPIPYFAARGFVGAPTGPFNQGADPRWSAGEQTALQIASTNEPTLSPGDPVTVELVTENHVLAREETRAT